MLDGEVVAPFCIGEGCGTEEGRDPKRSVGGSARIGMTAGCTGVELSVWTGSLTIGGVSYVALNPIGGGVAGSVVSLMGPRCREWGCLMPQCPSLLQRLEWG
eukprot:Sspe_Gene.3381::Locus_1110_Transcript_2_2_Confidence_0.667_Length_4186::g.3381::m.3381